MMHTINFRNLGRIFAVSDVIDGVQSLENKDKRIEAGMSRPMLYTRRRFACMQPLYRAIMTHANAIGPVTIYRTMGTNRRPIFFGILIKFLFVVVFCIRGMFC